MPPVIEGYAVLVFLFYAIVLGFGWSIDCWLWAVLLGAFKRG